MKSKKLVRKKNVDSKSYRSLIPKNININPFKIIQDTKKKIENYYDQAKKNKEKETIRLENQRKKDEKKEILYQKKTRSSGKIK